MRRALLLLLAALAADGRAEVLDSAPGGFTVQHERIVDASVDVVYAAAVERIGDWWSSDHTISGDASRLRIDASPQGCFCEDLEDGNGVVHLTVTFVNRNVLLRLTGGLGPLGLMGVDGNMTWEFFPAEDGRTRLKWTYAVGGYRPGGLDAVAIPVDYVIGEALARLGAWVETGDADNAEVPAAGG